MGFCYPALAQVTNTTTAIADAFVCTGSTNYMNGEDLTGLNFGAAGTLAIAPGTALKGEFQSVMKFNLSNGIALFNGAYGSNHWTIGAVNLILTSNYGTNGVQPNNAIFNVISGGQFVIEWLSDNDWVEGTGTPAQPTTDGITYDSLPSLLDAPREALCTNTYVPPGDNIPVTWPLPLAPSLVTNLSAGGDVTFHFYAADNQIGYLFNSYSYGRGNEPFLTVVANPLLQIVSASLTNGTLHLTGSAPPNFQGQVEATSGLAPPGWQLLGPFAADSAGVVQFEDPDAGNAPARFYRLSN